jgi:streptogramin lyase
MMKITETILSRIWFKRITGYLVIASAMAVSSAARSGVAPIEDLGPIVYSATQEQQHLFLCPPLNQYHIIMYYTTGPVWLVPFQVVDVNLSTGQYRVVGGLLGRPGPNATAYHPNGKVYIASSDPGYFMEYDPNTGQTRVISQLADKGGQFIQIGDDGALYLGETIKGIVERYDPATGAWTNYGIMDDPGPPYYRYAYTLGADQRYIYVGMGQNPWYLVVYDRQTGTQQTFWKNLNSACVMVYKGVSGGWFAQVSGLGWFKLENGQPTPLDAAPYILPWYRNGNQCSSLADGAQLIGINFDLSNATPYSIGSPGRAAIAWQPAGSNTWQSVQPYLRTIPQTIKEIYATPDNQLFGFTDFYGPVFTFNPASKARVILGSTFRSNYDAVYNPLNKRWYITGYAASTVKYDPTRRWTLTPLPSTGANPYYLSGSGKYHYYADVAASGYVFVGVHHERDSTGGELIWYNPTSDKKGSLRTPFLTQDVSDLKAALGGEKIVYAGKSMSVGEDAKLFIINARTMTLDRVLIPVPGLQTLGKIAEVAPGIVYGISGRKLYKVNILTGNIRVKDLTVDTFPNVAAYNQRLRIGPDGNLWLPVKSNGICYLAKIITATDSLLLVKPVTGVSSVTFVRNPRGYGYDAILCGGTNLRRISSLLP